MYDNIWILLHHRYLIFEIAKEHKRKRNGRICIEEITREILDEAALEDVDATPRICKCLDTKIRGLLERGRKARGGMQAQCLEETLKSSKPYELSIFVHETNQIQLIRKNQRLSVEKRRLEVELSDAQAKNRKLQEDISIVTASSLYWKNRFKSIVRRVMEQKLQQKTRSKRSFSEYSIRSQCRIKHELRSDCRAALDFVGLYDLIPTKVEYFDPFNQSYDSLSLLDEEEFVSLAVTENESVDKSALDDVYMLLYIKEKFNISNKAWSELSFICKDFPSTYSLKKRIEGLNAHWNLRPTPGASDGVQVSLAASLYDQIERLVTMEQLVPSEIVKVKVSGDGTRVGKRMQLLTVTYTIINEEAVAMTERGNYILAIVRTKDDYNGIRESLDDLCQEMSCLKSVTLNGAVYEVNMFLGGDWKFLATVCGLGPANHEFACIWCHCPRLQRYDTSKSWPLLDNKVSRTIASIEEHRKNKRKFNCQRVPLFGFIEMDHVIIDTLHLLLRISDVLIANLIRDLKIEDAVEKRTGSKQCHNTEKFIQHVNSLGIPFELGLNPDSKKLEYRELSGPERVTLLQSCDLKSSIPSFPQVHKIAELWADFFNIYTDLRKTFLPSEIDPFTQKLKAWIKDFIYLYEKSQVTPYMHALWAHVPDFLRLYSNIANFNQQGLEKYNDEASKCYFQATNHRGQEALHQMALKKSRIQKLEVLGAKRVKRLYCCRNCKKSGHTIKKCTDRCSKCNARICCSHLKKKDSRWERQCEI